MNRIVGYLIRSNRIKRKMSQEKLCSGICAVSYLSKIECGIAEPNVGILEALMQRMDITYNQDPEKIKEYEDLFFRYFDAYFHQESVADIEERIYRNKEAIQNSPLVMEYQIFCAYHAGKDDKKMALRILKSIQEYSEYLNENALFLYYMAKGMYSETADQRISAYKKARQVRDISIVYASLMYEAFYAENYQLALDYCRSGYERAMQEGFLLAAKQISFLEGVCCGKIGENSLMLKAYKRTKELSRGDKSLEAVIDYNIATSFLDRQKWEEAIPYLLSSLKQEKEEESAFYINHRLAMAYEKVDNKKVGRIYLEVAERLSERLQPVHRIMIEMCRIRYDEDALHSKRYGDILSLLFNMDKEMGKDFTKFYEPYMIEWLKANRKYKEAFRLVENNS